MSLVTQFLSQKSRGDLINRSTAIIDAGDGCDRGFSQEDDRQRDESPTVGNLSKRSISVSMSGLTLDIVNARREQLKQS
jgi:hypothetical protein